LPYDHFLQTGKSDILFYQKRFEELSKMGVDINRVLENTKNRVEQIADNELIREDNIYYWGAAEKMYAEGKIKIEPAEDQSAREKTEASSWQDKLLEPLLGPKYIQRQEIREDAALESIIKNLPQDKVVPLIFGEGHNFFESVDEFNQQSDSYKLGLVKLTPENNN